jgi:hypothetical protein
MAMQQEPELEVPTIEKRPIFQAYGSGNIPAKYGQTYGTFTYLHQLDPEIPIELGITGKPSFRVTAGVCLVSCIQPQSNLCKVTHSKARFFFGITMGLKKNTNFCWEMGPAQRWGASDKSSSAENHKISQ